MRRGGGVARSVIAPSASVSKTVNVSAWVRARRIKAFSSGAGIAAQTEGPQSSVAPALASLWHPAPSEEEHAAWALSSWWTAPTPAFACSPIRPIAMNVTNNTRARQAKMPAGRRFPIRREDETACTWRSPNPVACQPTPTGYREQHHIYPTLVSGRLRWRTTRITRQDRAAEAMMVVKRPLRSRAHTARLSIRAKNMTKAPAPPLIRFAA